MKCVRYLVRLTAVIIVGLCLLARGVEYDVTYHVHVPVADVMANGRAVLVYVKQQRTWNEASQICRALFPGQAGSLAKVDSQEAHRTVVKLLENDSNGVWFGLYNDRGSGDNRKLRWSDVTCSDFEFGNLAKFKTTVDENGDNDARCYYLADKGLSWNKDKCNPTRNFICEYQEFTNSTCGGGDTNATSRPYKMVKARFFSQETINASLAGCSSECTKLTGCFLTSPLPGNALCLMGVVDESASSLVKTECVTGNSLETLTAGYNKDEREVPGPCLPSNTSALTGNTSSSNEPTSTKASAGTCSTVTTTSTLMTIQIQPTTVTTTTTIISTSPVVQSAGACLVPSSDVAVEEEIRATPVRPMTVTTTTTYFTTKVQPTTVTFSATTTTTYFTTKVQPTTVTFSATTTTTYFTTKVQPTTVTFSATTTTTYFTTKVQPTTVTFSATTTTTYFTTKVQPTTVTFRSTTTTTYFTTKVQPTTVTIRATTTIVSTNLVVESASPCLLPASAVIVPGDSSQAPPASYHSTILPSVSSNTQVTSFLETSSLVDLYYNSDHTAATASSYPHYTDTVTIITSVRTHSSPDPASVTASSRPHSSPDAASVTASSRPHSSPNAASVTASSRPHSNPDAASVTASSRPHSSPDGAVSATVGVTNRWSLCPDCTCTSSQNAAVGVEASSCATSIARQMATVTVTDCGFLLTPSSTLITSLPMSMAAMSSRTTRLTTTDWYQQVTDAGRPETTEPERDTTHTDVTSRQLIWKSGTPGTAMFSGPSTSHNHGRPHLATQPAAVSLKGFPAIEDMTSAIISDLLLNDRELSKSRRTRESAMDTRVSARVSGGLAVLILCTVLSCVVIMDIPRVLVCVRDTFVTLKT